MYILAEVATAVYATDQLDEPLDASETGVDVDDGSKFLIGTPIKVDAEQMLITAIASNTLTVTRGYGTTTAETHLDNATVRGLAIVDYSAYVSAGEIFSIDFTNGKGNAGGWNADKDGSGLILPDHAVLFCRSASVAGGTNHTIRVRAQIGASHDDCLTALASAVAFTTGGDTLSTTRGQLLAVKGFADDQPTPAGLLQRIFAYISHDRTSGTTELGYQLACDGIPPSGRGPAW